MAMGVPGLGCEDALLHLLNYVWPNVFEDSPHLINGVMGAIDGCRLSLGPCVVLHYTLQVGGGGGRWQQRGTGMAAAPHCRAAAERVGQLLQLSSPVAACVQTVYVTSCSCAVFVL
jgi:hypothetical protein